MSQADSLVIITFFAVAVCFLFGLFARTAAAEPCQRCGSGADDLVPSPLGDGRELEAWAAVPHDSAPVVISAPLLLGSPEPVEALVVDAEVVYVGQ